jgi:hypothetical protein
MFKKYKNINTVRGRVFKKVKTTILLKCLIFFIFFLIHVLIDFILTLLFFFFARPNGD